MPSFKSYSFQNNRFNCVTLALQIRYYLSDRAFVFPNVLTRSLIDFYSLPSLLTFKGLVSWWCGALKRLSPDKAK